MLKRIQAFLFSPIHPSIMAYARIVIGCVFLYESLEVTSWARYYATEVLTNAEFRLTYDGFHWVAPLAQEKMKLLWDLMTVASIMGILGIFSRYAFAFSTFVWTYGWLLCNSMYNNHYYLLTLAGIFLVLVNTENWGSLKNLIFPKNKTRGKYVERWQIFIFQFQLLIVYLFGAFAKVNKDWLNGYPMKMWLPQKTLGPFTDFIHSEAGAMFFSYSGLLFDLFIGPMLFFRKTRMLAVPMLIIFHISNHFLWNIGVFPWFMLGITGIYFRPDWPARFAAFLANFFGKLKGQANNVFDRMKKSVQQIKIAAVPEDFSVSEKKRKVVLWVAGIYFLIQILIPCRQMLFKGDSAWTGEGFFFSWNMMLVDRPYSLRFKVVLPNNPEPQWLNLDCYTIDRNREMFPCDGFKGHMYLRQIQKLGHYPKHYIRYAKFLADDFQSKGLPKPEIYAYIWRQLNNRPYQLVLDTTANLVDLPYSSLKRTDIIQPFEDLPYKEQVDLLTEGEMRAFGLID